MLINKPTSFLQFFRLVFVIFSLFLMGDAFYRWDGFKLYASVAEFIPSIALASILWSAIALLTAFIVWLLLRAFTWLCGRMRLKIETVHLMVFSGVFAIITLLAWISKKNIWIDVSLTSPVKLLIIVSLLCIAALIAWSLRRKAEIIVQAIQERISPLIWLFGIFVVLSVPLVVYCTWGKSMSGESVQSYVTQPDAKRPNVILLTFDALTARNMSLYGYRRNTTPLITSWAKNASVFTRAYAESSYTAPTTASIITGKMIWTHRRYPMDYSTKPLKSKTENLALILKENGYNNYAFIQNNIASVEYLGVSDSFDFAPQASDLKRITSIGGNIDKHLCRLFCNKILIYNWLGQDNFIFDSFLRTIPEKVTVTEHPADEVFDQFLVHIDQNTDKPFFSWIHLNPPHDPYLPPRPYVGTYSSSSEMRDSSSQITLKRTLRHTFKSNTEPQPTEVIRKVKLLRDYYDEFILYCDRQFNDFVEELDKRGLLDNTIIILSSDHGESFEHDYFFHGGPHLYEQVTHIPLIIKEPGKSEGLIIDSIVEQVDIPVTILDMVGIPVPAWMEGRSLVPYMRNFEVPSKPAFAMQFIKNDRRHQITKGTIAVWKGDYKLIYYLEDNKSLLFNLKQDPDELNNLFSKENEIAQQLLSLIKDNLKKANDKIVSDNQKL